MQMTTMASLDDSLSMQEKGSKIAHRTYPHTPSSLEIPVCPPEERHSSTEFKFHTSKGSGKLIPDTEKRDILHFQSLRRGVRLSWNLFPISGMSTHSDPTSSWTPSYCFLFLSASPVGLFVWSVIRADRRDRSHATRVCNVTRQRGQDAHIQPSSHS
ncbi:hypothetical protein B0H63DRAFT_56400 [Podospora didyma]|uniref:Uncharacterized protein n=1 Tax=Podospora didyma TaxID=330526 RepID=A0AAE0U8T5_9PEZI|nr:hypothetical protein B0H63DRAFT_56400 [Podospora didyma]